MKPSDMYYKVAFDALVGVPDGSGGEALDWVEQFTSRAHYRFLRGSEAVVAARLQGKQPVVVTIWANDETRTINPEWRMRDARSGTIYNIRTAIPTDDRRYIELTCESGVTV